jgi:hypothetical protein
MAMTPVTSRFFSALGIGRATGLDEMSERGLPWWMVAIVVKGWRWVMRRRRAFAAISCECDRSMSLRSMLRSGKERFGFVGCLQRLGFWAHERVDIRPQPIGRLVGCPPFGLDVATSRLPSLARAFRAARTLADAVTQEAAISLPAAAIDAKGS